MRALLIRAIPGLIALALVLHLATTATGEPSALLGAAIVLACVAAGMAGSLVVASRAIGRSASWLVRRDAGRADPAPAHPDTAGRPRPRAPGAAVPAA
jgi:hypothetical protein